MANEVENVGGTAATGAGLGSMLLPGIGTAIGAGAGGLLGLIKSIMAGENEKKDRIMQATTTRYSPWTKLKAGEVARTNPLGEISAGITGGAQLGQSAQKAAADKAVTDAIAAKMSGAPAQAGQQQGASAPIVTPDEAGKAPIPTAPMPEDDDLVSNDSGGKLEKILKLMRVAQGGRQSYGNLG